MEDESDLAVYWMIGTLEDLLIQVKRFEAIGTAESKAHARRCLARIRSIIEDFEIRYSSEDGQGSGVRQ